MGGRTPRLHGTDHRRRQRELVRHLRLHPFARNRDRGPLGMGRAPAQDGRSARMAVARSLTAAVLSAKARSECSASSRWDRRRCAGRSALRRGWRLCLLSAWASVGSVTGRCARPDGHPDLGIDGGIFRRARACSGQRTRTLSRPLLLLVHRRVQCRCLHSPSRAGERRPHTIGESGVAARCGRNRGIGLLCSATRVSTTLPEGLHLLWSSPVPDRWGPLASWVRSAEPEVLARPARPAPLAQAGELPPDLCFTGGPKL